MDYSKLEAEVELQKISNYFKAKDYINVEDNTKKLIKRFPNHLPIYNLLGLSLHYQGKYLEAIKNFKSSPFLLFTLGPFIFSQTSPNFFHSQPDDAINFSIFSSTIYTFGSQE